MMHSKAILKWYLHKSVTSKHVQAYLIKSMVIPDLKMMENIDAAIFCTDTKPLN